MSRWRAVLVCGVIALAGAVAPSATGSQPDRMLAKLNEVRQRHDLSALRYSASLTRSSQRFANRLMAADVFGHAARIQASNRFDHLGEVLAFQPGYAPHRFAAVRGWLASPSHRALVLSPSFRYVGVAHASGRFDSRAATIWVGQFGSR